ncbi:hypothetical protein RA279_30770, partial [Pseudomonas syringae pv. tagetis]|uniref:hypothetical protein n=1 Tax=Pseudomonas syringae group genomosp. 7 TaxID=251699 RepID=UPI00376F9AEF
QMATAALARNELHPMTTYEFTNDIDKIKFENISVNLTIFVASYLLASASIDSALRAQKINRVHGIASLGPSAVLYT